jgi:preprotein translocase subunit SecG
MFYIVLVISLLLSASLIVMVLLQPSKGGGLGSTFGGFGGSLGSTFGTRRTLDFLAKATAWTAGIIAVVAIVSNLFLTPSGGSQQRGIVTEDPATAPPATAPAPTPTTPTQPQAVPQGGQQAPPAGDAAPPAGNEAPAPAQDGGQ